MRAAFRGDVDTTLSADVAQSMSKGDTIGVLDAAAAADHSELVKRLLIDGRVPVHALHRSLFLAVALGNYDVVDAFLAHWPEQEGFKYNTVLRQAAYFGHTAVLDLVAGYAVGVRAPVRVQRLLADAAFGGLLALRCAIRFREQLSPEQLVPTKGLAIHLVTAKSSMDVPGVLCAIQALVDAGEPVTGVDADGRTALEYTSSADVLRKLLDFGVDRWHENNKGRTVRDRATRKRWSSLVRVLDTCFPVTPQMTQALLGLRGPTPSSLTRLADHAAFDMRVLTLVDRVLTGRPSRAFDKLVEQAYGNAVQPRGAEEAPQPRGRVVANGLGLDDSPFSCRLRAFDAEWSDELAWTRKKAGECIRNELPLLIPLACTVERAVQDFKFVVQRLHPNGSHPRERACTSRVSISGASPPARFPGSTRNEDRRPLHHRRAQRGGG